MDTRIGTIEPIIKGFDRLLFAIDVIRKVVYTLLQRLVTAADANAESTMHLIVEIPGIGRIDFGFRKLTIRTQFEGLAEQSKLAISNAPANVNDRSKAVGLCASLNAPKGKDYRGQVNFHGVKVRQFRPF